MMGRSAARKHTRIRFFEGLFDKVSESQVETLEILADVDQLAQLMSSMMDVRTGHVIPLYLAFQDIPVTDSD